MLTLYAQRPKFSAADLYLKVITKNGGVSYAAMEPKRSKTCDESRVWQSKSCGEEQVSRVIRAGAEGVSHIDRSNG